MSADKVFGLRLIGGRGLVSCFRQKLHLKREQVTEDARHGHHHVDARTTKIVQWHERSTAKPAIAVKSRPRAHQCQRLRDRLALGLEVVGSP